MSPTSTVAEVLPDTTLDGLQIRNILCPVDFSEFSSRALTYAASIARHFEARLFVQHTVHIPKSAYVKEIDEVATRAVLEAELKRAGIDPGRLSGPEVRLPEIHIVISGGDVMDHLLQSIGRYGIDLVVMGSHGRKGFNRLILGSVTERIVHEALCPVLVVSRPQHDFVGTEPAEAIRLHTILLATDFSPNAGRALAHALKWASEWGGNVILFHAVETEQPAGRVDLFPEYNPYFEKQLVEAWEAIQKMVPVQRKCEISCEVRHGNPREQIVRLAEERGADLIVMGSRGLGMTAATWGSTISGVVRDGRFPVLAVRHVPASVAETLTGQYLSHCIVSM